jgi:hypothetical protein
MGNVAVYLLVIVAVDRTTTIGRCVLLVCDTEFTYMSSPSCRVAAAVGVVEPTPSAPSTSGVTRFERISQKAHRIVPQTSI